MTTNKILHKPSSAIHVLWQENFFSVSRKLSDVRGRLNEKGIHFPDAALINAMKAAKFLIRGGHKGTYSFVQKSPPPGAHAEEISPVAHFEEIIYDKGYAYDFYRDIKSIIESTRNEVMIVDPYVNEELFNLYLEKLPKFIKKVKILTNPNNPKGNFYTVAKKFSLKPKIKFEVRESSDCHDRAIFVDDRAWVFGQSIKDAGKKPTYLIPVNESKKLREVFDSTWKSSVKTI